MGRHSFYIHGQGKTGSEGCIVPRLEQVLHFVTLLRSKGPLYLRVEGSDTLDLPDKPSDTFVAWVLQQPQEFRNRLPGNGYARSHHLPECVSTGPLARSSEAVKYQVAGSMQNRYLSARNWPKYFTSLTNKLPTDQPLVSFSPL